MCVKKKPRILLEHKTTCCSNFSGAFFHTTQFGPHRFAFWNSGNAKQAAHTHTLKTP